MSGRHNFDGMGWFLHLYNIDMACCMCGIFYEVRVISLGVEWAF